MVDKRVFNPEKALDPFDEHFNWDDFNKDVPIDDPEEMIKQHKEIK